MLVWYGSLHTKKRESALKPARKTRISLFGIFGVRRLFAMFYVLFPLRPESFRKIWRCQVQGWRRKIWLSKLFWFTSWLNMNMDPVDMNWWYLMGKYFTTAQYTVVYKVWRRVIFPDIHPLAMGQKKQQIAESLWKKGDLTTTDASRGGIQSPRRQMSEFHRKCLVGGFKDVFSISYMDIYGIILPIDFHIFQRGWNHQPDVSSKCKKNIGLYVSNRPQDMIECRRSVR